MTRPIKFRAWDKKNNKWIDDTDIAINQKGDLFIRHEHQVEFSPMSRTKSETYEVVFSTGLLDKNGKEIYEGDILSCQQNIVSSDDPSGGSLRKVVFDGEYAKFEAAYIDGNTRTSGKVFCSSNTTKSYEIIGNIYENPELLKEERKNVYGSPGAAGNSPSAHGAARGV